MLPDVYTRTVRAEPRPLPGARLWRMGLRTLHVIAVSALYGGHVYGASADQLKPALAATVATGLLFLSLEVYRAPVWLVQVRGIATLAKVVIALGVLVAWELRVPILTFVVAVGVLTSHMPGRWRYYSVIHRGAVGPREKG